MNALNSQSNGPRPRGTDAEERSKARQRLIQTRARRLGIEPAEAEAQLDAERQAWGAARPVVGDEESSLDRAEEDLDAMDFPTPQCLDPHEVEEAVAGELTADRQEHADSCPFCRTLLGVATPAEAGVDSFLNEVRATCGAARLTLADLDDDSAPAVAETGPNERKHKEHRRAVPATRFVREGRALLTGAAATLLIGWLGIRSGYINPAAHRSGRPGEQPSLTLRGSWTQEEINGLGKLLTSQQANAPQDVQTITVSPDRSRMAILKNDGNVILWTPTETKELAEFGGKQGAEPFIHFSDQGKLLVKYGTANDRGSGNPDTSIDTMEVGAGAPRTAE